MAEMVRNRELIFTIVLLLISIRSLKTRQKQKDELWDNWTVKKDKKTDKKETKKKKRKKQMFYIPS